MVQACPRNAGPVRSAGALQHCSARAGGGQAPERFGPRAPPPRVAVGEGGDPRESDSGELADDFAAFFEAEAELSLGVGQEAARADAWRGQGEELDGEEEEELDFLFEAQSRQAQRADEASERAQQHQVESVPLLPGGEPTAEQIAAEGAKVVALPERDSPAASERPSLQYAWRDSGLWLRASDSLGAPAVELPQPGSAALLHVRFGAEGRSSSICIGLPPPFPLDPELCTMVERRESEEESDDDDDNDDERRVWHVAFGRSGLAPLVGLRDPPEAALDLKRAELAASISARGWGVVDGFLRGAEADEVHLLLRDWWETGKLEPWKKKVVCDEYVYMDTRGVVAPAGTGWRGDVFTQGGPLPEGLYGVHNRLNRFMQELGMSLPELGGMLEVENPMLAAFPGGGTRYARHFDSAGSTRRVCTAILYLNPFWRKDHGGELRMFPELEGGEDCPAAELGAMPDGERTVTLDPLHGRLVAFLCDERNAHEVMPAFRPRMAITWWVRRPKVGPG